MIEGSISAPSMHSSYSVRRAYGRSSYTCTCTCTTVHSFIMYMHVYVYSVETVARTGVVGSYTVGKGSFAFVWWGWALSYDFASIPRAPIVKKEEPGIVICGKQAIDNDLNATGQMLSALLGWSQATFASELSIEGDKAIVTREVDGGLQTIKVNLPSVVTVDLRLNEPRYASLPNIMKAKKKPLEVMSAEDLGVDVSPRLKIKNTGEPEARAAGIKVGSVDELVEKLKEMGAV